MKHLPLLTACLLFAPLAADAQVEIGIDAGLKLDVIPGSDNVTQVNIPTGSARIGFRPPGDRLSFETLLSFDIISSGGTFAVLDLKPGLNFSVGDGGGYYVRGEVAMLLLSGGGTTDTEFGGGAAFGVKKPINDGPISFRFEVGYDRFIDADVNQFRLLFGLSAEVGG